MNNYAPQARGLTSSVNFATEGKQHGHLSLPASSPDSRHGRAQIPICCINSGAGPRVVMLAGSHGDEFDGPLALQRLAMELTTADIHGCLVLVPSMNLSAARCGTRVSSKDSADLDVCFPGSVDGTISEQIASAIFQHIIGGAELVVELQSGGASMQYAPSACVHFDTANQQPQRNAESSMIAFGAPNSTRLPPAQQGSLAAACQLAGVNYISSILGGGATATAANIAVAITGCKNVLVQQGMLQREIELRATRMLEVSDETCFITATVGGLLEMCRDIGCEVFLGNPLARIVDIGRTGADPHVITANRNGVLLARHHGGLIYPGDCIAILADEVQR